MSERTPQPRSGAGAGDRNGPVFVGTRGGSKPQNLADVLERVLDKGIVIVGDIQVRLLDIELLTIKVRLMVASVERAREMGINWWEGDPFVANVDENGRTEELQRKVEELERRLAAVDGTDGATRPLPEGERSRNRG